MKPIWKLGTLACLSLWACQPVEQVSPPQPSPSASISPSTAPSPSTTPSPDPVTTPQPSATPTTPEPSPSVSPEPAEPSPSVSPEPAEPSPSVSPEPAEPSPDATPQPTSSPALPAAPLRFGEIKVITGSGRAGMPESGIQAENMPFPDFISGIASDKENNIWILNSGEGRMGYITPIINSTSSTQTVEYRLYWERIRDLQNTASLLYSADTELFYAVETFNNRVISIDPSDGKVTVLAGNGTGGYNGDGPALERQLNQPEGLARDAAGNLYIADTGNHLIRKVTPDGQMQTIAGQYILDTRVEDEDDVASFLPEGATSGDGGPALQARLKSPRNLAVSADGSALYITGDFASIRWIRNGIIDKLAGSGTTGYNGDGIAAHLAHLNQPTAMTIGPDNLLYFIDSNNLRIRRIRPASPFALIESVAGSGQDQEFASARSDALAVEMRPRAITFDTAGNLWIYDQTHRRLRRLERNNTPTTNPESEINTGASL
ncbi:MAG: hypothetical protein IGS03_10150 [Candidatus Sericytochromatia bacterium]|nr:hypothetical protein [Candidatus Sericytochromatia bacterium]